LMDIHTSMMGDNTILGTDNTGTSQLIDNINRSNSESHVEAVETLEDVDMIYNPLSTSAEQPESALSLNVLPTVTVVDKTDPSEMFSSDFTPGWSGLGSAQQLPEAAENGFMLFGDSSTRKHDVFSAIEQGVKMESEDNCASSSSTSLIKLEVGVGNTEHPPINTFKIFVSGLPPGMKNEELEELFKPYGNVLECEIFSSKNYAFVVRK